MYIYIYTYTYIYIYLECVSSYTSVCVYRSWLVDENKRVGLLSPEKNMVNDGIPKRPRWPGVPFDWWRLHECEATVCLGEPRSTSGSVASTSRTAFSQGEKPKPQSAMCPEHAIIYCYIYI